ncbi:MAG: chemotaxis protein CheW [bacterium]|nr:chemotaxis protein CheW [Candidatus Sumerlaeota bacterium]
MLFVLLKIDADTYALDAERVVKILPLVTLKLTPHSPHGIAGLLNYRQQAVPVADLTMCATGRASRPMLTTRILLVNYPAGSETAHLLGVIAEGISRTEQLDPDKFEEAGIEAREAGYLGPVMAHNGELIQRIEIEHLLTEETKARLFTGEEAAAWRTL